MYGVHNRSDMRSRRNKISDALNHQGRLVQAAFDNPHPIGDVWDSSKKKSEAFRREKLVTLPRFQNQPKSPSDFHGTNLGSSKVEPTVEFDNSPEENMSISERLEFRSGCPLSQAERRFHE